MKRQWILGLAAAVGVSLLSATPGSGDDKKVTNDKKPATAASKPAASTTANGPLIVCRLPVRR